MDRELDSDAGRSALNEVLADYMRRIDRGEKVDQHALIAAYPELATDLRAYFSQAGAVERLADGATADFTRQVTPRGSLEVRCPNCHQPTEVAVDTTLTDLTCSACGSHFSLVDQSKATRMAPSLTKLGRFELIERLGVGGFGSVWKARDKELDRTVAIKIPRAGGMTGDEQEKFFREARAAAQLRHPSIVSVHEVGRDGDNVYIVSDFVRGVTLGDWLTGQQLTSREAAELCARIADALHHAHEQGVVHRDLKPANIMIDSDGQPHLMDFGLARRDVGEVTVTMDGQILGTPAYMSPEQAQGEAHTADRRSDVYSLGVILFQLLTGELPFRGNARMLMHQVIHDEPPSPRKLNAHVPRDLETITLTCLEKEPRKRYQTAQELSEELRRFLSGEPIHARPTGHIESAWRWAKRRPAAAALLALLIIATIGVSMAFLRERSLRREVAAQKNEAESERNSAAAVVRFLTDDVLGKATPQKMPDKAMRDALVKTLLEPAAATVGERFDGQPMIAAAIRESISETLLAIGRADLALPNAERALQQRRNLLGSENPETIRSSNNYATVLWKLGRMQEAEPLLKGAVENSRRVLGENHPDTIRMIANHALVLLSLDRNDEAELKSKVALEKSREALGENHPATIKAQADYASILWMLGGRNEEAAKLGDQVLKKYRDTLGEDHPDTIQAMNNHAVRLRSVGRMQDAEPLFRQALKQYRKVLGEDHPDTLSSMSDLATAYVAESRFNEAATIESQLCEKVQTMARVATPYEQYWVASALLGKGKLEENRRTCHELLQEFEKTGGLDVANRAAYAYVAAPVPASDAQQVVSAAASVTRWFKGNERILGAALYRNGEYSKALQAFKESHDNFTPKAWDYCFLAMAHFKRGDASDARKALMRARSAHKNAETEWYSYVETEALFAEATALIERESPAADFVGHG